MISYTSISLAATSAIVLSTTLAISAAQAQEPMLTDTVWELQQILYNNDTSLEPTNPADYTIQFFEDGTVGVQADCNVVRGTYDVQRDFIALGPSTLAACGPDSIDDEYRRGLEDAVGYLFEDGDLYMDLPVDVGTLRFSPAPEIAEEIPEMTEDPIVEEPVIEPEPEVEPEPAPIRGLW